MEAQRIRDDKKAVREALDSLRAATGIPVAIGGLVGANRKLRLSESIGFRTDAMKDLTIEPGHGVGGRVMSTLRPVGVSDYARANVITHEYDRPVLAEGLRSMAAVPVVVNREVRAVLYGGVHSSVRLGDKVLGELTQTARCLEQALAVNDALRERGGSALTGADGPAPTTAEWEQLRNTHSRLRMIASRTEDPVLRAELEELCEQMVRPVAIDQAAHLSARELDVLACVALGHTNVEAAKELGIGAETVKSYLRSVMRKLGARTRYEAVNAARRIGALP